MVYEKSRQKRKEDRGFTLIEILVSLVLVSLALVLIAAIIHVSIDAHRKSCIRFHMLQTLESTKNDLISKSFDSDELRDGTYSGKDGEFLLSWHIQGISPSLKKIRLKVSYEKDTVFNKRIYFYKSKFIKERKND